MNRELFRPLPSVHPRLFATVLFGLLGAGATIAQAVLLSQLIGRAFPGHTGLDRVADLVGLLLIVILIRSAFIAVRQIMARNTAVYVKSELRRRLLEHISRLGPAYIRGERTGELVTTATEGIERLDAYVSGYLPQVVLTVCVPLLIAVAILPVDWISAVLLVATAPIIPILMILIGGYAERRVRQQWISLSRLGADFLDTVQGLQTIVLFGHVQARRERLAAAGAQLRETTVQTLRVASLSGAVLELMCALAIGLIAVSLALRLLDGGISFERALIVFFLTPEFYRPIRDLGVQYHAGREGAAAATRVMEILQTKASVEVSGAATPRIDAPITVALSGVAYTYPDSDLRVLDDIDLLLPASTCTAVIGRSGAGKSTLINLLLRFADPIEGNITVNGTRLAALPADTWHQYVALVPQRPHLFTGSILDNIRLSRPYASLDAVHRAAELAGVSRFIERFSDGYQTVLGERGARLSAGEAQRVSIARAFLKDAPLLILDEPTSSLDPESEMLIREAVRLLTRDRTVLVVAHRMNTVAAADQIAVLDQGRLLETGNHATLMARNGAYAAFLRAGHEVQMEVAG